MPTIKISNLPNLLDKITECVETLGPKVELAVMTDLKGRIKQRIHNKGLDSSGSPILGGSYSPEYARFRKGKGRQVQRVDLEVFGNLRRGFSEIRTDGRTQLGFVDDDLALIAEVQEQRNGSPIYAPSDGEKSSIEKIIKVVSTTHLKKCAS